MCQEVQEKKKKNGKWILLLRMYQAILLIKTPKTLIPPVNAA